VVIESPFRTVIFGVWGAVPARSLAVPGCDGRSRKESGGRLA
jgi:hypothetical protein